MYTRQLKRECERAKRKKKKCIRTTMKKISIRLGGARRRKRSKMIFFFGCEFTLKKYAFDIICNGLLLLPPFLPSFLLTSTNLFSLFSLSLSLPACLLACLSSAALSLCVYEFFSSTFAFSIDAIFLFFHTEKKNRRNFLHVSS